MTKRERVLATIRAYCANGREREAMRLYTEHRISYQCRPERRGCA